MIKILQKSAMSFHHFAFYVTWVTQAVSVRLALSQEVVDQSLPKILLQRGDTFILTEILCWVFKAEDYSYTFSLPLKRQISRLRFIPLQGVRAHKNLVHSSHLEQRIFAMQYQMTQVGKYQLIASHFMAQAIVLVIINATISNDSKNGIMKES